MAKKIHLRKGSCWKDAYDGFSWTTLFFGLFVPLIRGDSKWVLIGLAAIVAGALTTPFVGIVYNFVMAFMYNEIHYNDLREAGWERG